MNESTRNMLASKEYIRDQYEQACDFFASTSRTVSKEVATERYRTCVILANILGLDWHDVNKEIESYRKYGKYFRYGNFGLSFCGNASTQLDDQESESKKDVEEFSYVPNQSVERRSA